MEGLMILSNVLSLISSYLIISSFLYQQHKNRLFLKIIFEISCLELAKSLFSIAAMIFSFKNFMAYCQELPAFVGGMFQVFYENSIMIQIWNLNRFLMQSLMMEFSKAILNYKIEFP